MADPRVEKLAKLVVNYSIYCKKGEQVLISAPATAEPLAVEIFREVLRAGAHPIMNVGLERANEVFYEEAGADQLRFASPYRKFLFEHVDATIGISSESNTRAMSGVESKKMAMTSAAMAEAREIHGRRSAAGELKWCGLVYPSNGLAQEAGMSLAEYEDFVYGACFVDKKDPIAEWKKVSAMQQKMVDYLDGVKRLEFYGEDTDIKMSLKGRRWMNSDGKHNMPSGEVFSAPVEDSVEGRIRFTYPGIFQGKEIEDVSLTFRKGKVVKAEAAKGGDLLKALLAIDDGAKRLGEVAIGTNDGIKRFTKKILFDEKLGGTIHMALGSAYLECGAKNRSAIHWDLIKDMTKGGEIYGDGVLIYKDGKFLK